jgi:hypothetical protein
MPEKLGQADSENITTILQLHLIQIVGTTYTIVKASKDNTIAIAAGGVIIINNPNLNGSHITAVDGTITDTLAAK